MIFFIADTHFGHQNIIQYDNRPFKSVEEMDAEMIRRWNLRVSGGDTVYILGDFSWYNTRKTTELLRRLNGSKRLIKGNHDRIHSVELGNEFESIHDYEQIEVEGKRVVLCHYSIPFYPGHRYGAIMLHGHTHHSKEHFLEMQIENLLHAGGIPCQMINVGCMLPYMDYTPRTLDEILRGKEQYGHQAKKQL
mgnify:CR=1 FL=1|jgi:hypothetical protein